MAKKLPLISVVVCSLNGADVITDALKAIKAQKWAGKLEIIVVDDGSTDDTYKIAKSFKGVKVIKNKTNLGTAKSRNIGTKAAKGEIIAFTDDDCRPRPTWIKELYAGYNDDTVMGVGGDIISNDTSSLTLRYLKTSQINKPLDNKLLKSKSPFYRFASYVKALTGLNRQIPNRKRSVYSVATANASFRKAALEKIGMFDERFTFAGEDVDLCKRLNKAYPESLWYAPKAKVIHQFDDRLSDTLRRSRAYGVGNAQLLRKHQDFLPPIYPFPPLILAAFLLGLINPWLLLTPFVLVPAVYSLGVRKAIKTRSLEPLLYGYVQYLQEWYGNIGFFKGYWKFRKTFLKSNTLKSSLLKKQPSQNSIDNLISSKEFNFSIDTAREVPEKQPDKNNSFWSEAGLAVLVLGLVLLATLVKSNTIFHVPAAIVIVVFSGYFVLRGFRAESEYRLPGMLRLSLITILGIAWLMFFGILADVVLSFFGFKHPLSSNWLPLIFVLSTGLLIPWSLKYKSAAIKKPAITFNRNMALLGGLLTLMLLFSFCGARLLNNGYTNILVILEFVIGIISATFAIVRQKHLPEYVLPLTLFVISVASVWSYSLRSNYVFGWDIQQEFHVFQTTLASGKWVLGAKHSAYGAMLSLTILPVTIAKITGLSGLTFFKFLSPLFFGFFPVFLYYTYRLFTKRWLSFLGALVIISQFYYMQQFSALVRQQIGFLFFASIMYNIVQNKLSHSTKNYLLLVSILGLVVSHYATAYLAIIFLGVAYIGSKIIAALASHYKQKQFQSKQKYIHGWVIIALIASVFVWYIPATHSSKYLEKFFQTHEYTHIVQNVDILIRKQFTNSQPSPKNTKDYLQTIGNKFQKTHNNFDFYLGASNSTVHPVKQATIKAKWPAVHTLLDGVGILLNYAWWFIGSAGIIALFIFTYRKFEYRMLELATLATSGIVGFIAIHLSPTFQHAYNSTRLDEQVLMFVALPFILMLTWLLKGLTIRTVKFIVSGTVLLSFAIASGILSQFFGGLPTANLNNFGQDYNNFYIHETDRYSALWLGDRYTPQSKVFDDNYGGLRLTAAKTQIYNQFLDVTPQTISKDSFVYGDYTNIKVGLVDKQVNTKQFSYQFPNVFLLTHKNLVYSNGDAEVYK